MIGRRSSGYLQSISNLQQVLSQGGRDGFGAVGGAHFREQRREVFAYARDADSELF